MFINLVKRRIMIAQLIWLATLPVVIYVAYRLILLANKTLENKTKGKVA